MKRRLRLLAGAAGARLAIAMAWLAFGPATAPAAGPVDARGVEAPTWSGQIARLVQDRCQECHRQGEIAPFPLLDYADAYAHRRKIQNFVERRKMPPWMPAPGFGDFLDARRLSAAEIALVRAWVEAGAPEGDTRDLPPRRAFPETWTLGPPDVVLEPSEAFEVPAGGKDIYRCFVIPTSFPEDRYVSAVEFVPGNRKVVHHVLTYIDTGGQAEALDRAESGPGYTCFGGPGFLPRGGLGGWAPGARPQQNSEGTGLLLPAGASVVVQVHYHPTKAGPETDRTRVGVHFSRTQVDKRIRVLPVLNRSFLIPAGAKRHEVQASFTLPPTWNLHAVAISPHMHLLGREMKVTATLPDGGVTPLIHVDDWDFHWQGSYTFSRPVALPGGTRIDVVAVYDNSPANRRNPSSPPRDVGWGDATTDEMCIVFLRVTADAERLGHLPQYSGTARRADQSGQPARPVP